MDQTALPTGMKFQLTAYNCVKVFFILIIIIAIIHGCWDFADEVNSVEEFASDCDYAKKNGITKAEFEKAIILDCIYEYVLVLAVQLLALYAALKESYSLTLGFAILYSIVNFIWLFDFGIWFFILYTILSISAFVFAFLTRREHSVPWNPF